MGLDIDEGPCSEIDYLLKTEYSTPEHSVSFRLPEGRKIVRAQFRNNIANELAYGALTGESVAMHYVRTGQWEIKPGDIVAVHSDGLNHVLDDGMFIDKIRQKDIEGIRKVCQKKVKTEGTMVLYFNEK